MELAWCFVEPWSNDLPPDFPELLTDSLDLLLGFPEPCEDGSLNLPLDLPDPCEVCSLDFPLDLPDPCVVCSDLLPILAEPCTD